MRVGDETCPVGTATRDVLDGPGDFGGRQDGDGNSNAGSASVVSNELLVEAWGGGSVAGSAPSPSHASALGNLLDPEP
jgi:hypothetical protein